MPPLSGHLSFLTLLGGAWADRVCVEFLAAAAEAIAAEEDGADAAAEGLCANTTPEGGDAAATAAVAAVSPRVPRRASLRGFAIGM